MDDQTKTDIPRRSGTAFGSAEQLSVVVERPPGVPTKGLRKMDLADQEVDKRPFPGTSEDLSSAFFISAMLIVLIIAIFYFLPSS